MNKYSRYYTFPRGLVYGFMSLLLILNISLWIFIFMVLKNKPNLQPPLGSTSIIELGRGWKYFEWKNKKFILNPTTGSMTQVR